jgi:hypothetical protein
MELLAGGIHSAHGPNGVPGEPDMVAACFITEAEETIYHLDRSMRRHATEATFVVPDAISGHKAKSLPVVDLEVIAVELEKNAFPYERVRLERWPFFILRVQSRDSIFSNFTAASAPVSTPTRSVCEPTSPCQDYDLQRVEVLAMLAQIEDRLATLREHI